MSSTLPALFAAMAGGMLLLALFALWQSLRATFGTAGAVSPQASESARRAGLNDEKAALLESLRDLDLEREGGKISEGDFKQLEGKLRSRAKHVLRLLDEDVAPFRAEAETMIAAHLKKIGEAPYGAGGTAVSRCPSCGASNDPDADHCKKCGVRYQPVACSGCGKVNDADATFCKKCGSKLGSGTKLGNTK